MLMIDGVEGPLGQQIPEVVGFDDEGPAWSQYGLDPRQEIAQPGNVWKGIGRGDDRCLAPFAHDLLSGVGIEKSDVALDRFVTHQFGEVSRRVDPHDPDAVTLETAQQGAVVATDINDKGARRWMIALDEEIAQIKEVGL